MTAGADGYEALGGTSLEWTSGARPGSTAIGIRTTTAGGGVAALLNADCPITPRDAEGNVLDVAVRLELADAGLFRGDDAAPASLQLIASRADGSDARTLLGVTLDARTLTYGVLLPRDLPFDALRLELVTPQPDRQILVEAFEVFVVSVLDATPRPVLANGAFADGFFGFSMEGRPRLFETSAGNWALVPAGAAISQRLPDSGASRFEVAFRATAVEDSTTVRASLRRPDGTEIEGFDCLASTTLATCTGTVSVPSPEASILHVSASASIAVHGLSATEAP